MGGRGTRAWTLGTELDPVCGSRAQTRGIVISGMNRYKTRANVMADKGLSKTGDRIFLTGSHRGGIVSATGAASEDPGRPWALGPGPWGREGGREGADGWKGWGKVSLGPTSESEVLAGVSGSAESGKWRGQTGLLVQMSLKRTQ